MLKTTLSCMCWHFPEGSNCWFFHYPRVLQALSSLALDVSRDPGAFTASLHTLCQGLPMLTGKDLFPVFNLNFSSGSLYPFPLSIPAVPDAGFLSGFPVAPQDPGRCWELSTHPALPQGEQSHFSQPVSMDRCSSPPVNLIQPLPSLPVLLRELGCLSAFPAPSW